MSHKLCSVDPWPILPLLYTASHNQEHQPHRRPVNHSQRRLPHLQRHPPNLFSTSYLTPQSLYVTLACLYHPLPYRLLSLSCPLPQALAKHHSSPPIPTPPPPPPPLTPVSALLSSLSLSHFLPPFPPSSPSLTHSSPSSPSLLSQAPPILTKNRPSLV